VIADGETILLPDASQEVVVQCEIGIVIGRTTRRISASDAPAHILGYTCLNDVTALDLFRTGLRAAAKWFDTFLPAGPRIVSTLPATGVEMTAALNGEVRLRGHSSELGIGMHELVSIVSHLTTLEEGDLVMSGGPGGPPEVTAGDDVEIRIEGIGSLRNSVGAVPSSGIPS
jgi:2-keto-4-pentenoate hydratase/2-oxohepta-3-ene-1,7-dioic acid hydratase in catechol pathway